MTPDRKFRRHDRKIFGFCLLSGLPAVIVALAFLFLSKDESGAGPWILRTRGFLTVTILLSWFGFAAAARTTVVRLFQTIANLLAALREGDFSIRGRVRGDDPLGEVFFEINSLGDVLREQRLGAVEASALLRRVMEEIEVAIFAIDAAGVLRLLNRAGAALLGKPADQLLGQPAKEIGLEELLEGEGQRILHTTVFASGPGRWGMRRSSFRERGIPHSLIVVAELSRALREEELLAWQRLVRVLGHELNNSLAPIKSLAGTLGALIERDPRPADWAEDMKSGLKIIEARADSLNRFTIAYARLARLPAPQFAACELDLVLRQVASLETRLQVTIEPLRDPALNLYCDCAQIEQVLINLVKNAVESVLEARAQGRPEAGVRISARADVDMKMIEVKVIDDGLGLANPANLFVPFFTTKASGTGIGLVLCRQIVENHRGTLTLSNRNGRPGSVAKLRIPNLAPPRA